MKSHWNHSKDLKVKHMMYILKKSIRLHYTVMMIRDYKQLLELHHIQMVQVLEKYKKWSY